MHPFVQFTIVSVEVSISIYCQRRFRDSYRLLDNEIDRKITEIQFLLIQNRQQTHVGSGANGLGILE